jgi:hypothetical protein
MVFVDGDVVVRQVDAKQWELREPVVYQGARETFTVPTGFRTDFASIPRLVVWLIPRYGLYTRSAILHDYLCKTEVVDRADADGLFRRSMRELGVSIPRRWMMWAGVRLASRMSHADVKQWLAFLVVAPLSLAFVAVPALVVQVFLLLFWVIELAFWLVHRAVSKQRPPAPRLQVRTA